MQFRIIYKTSSLSWAFSLLMTITTTVMAGSNNSHYSLQHAGNQVNPWAIPPTQDRYRQDRSAKKYQGQQQRPENQNQHNQNKIWRQNIDRFVTPEDLESLKQTQTKNQLMPGDYRFQYQQRSSQPTMSQQPLPGNYSYPSYGMGNMNPLYDAPAVSPWGSGADMLYRGESFPMVPNEAIGGIPPLYTPSFGGSNFGSMYSGEPGNANKEKGEVINPEIRKQNQVFNPFTFLPDGAYK